jgi:hypothetical protein
MHQLMEKLVLELNLDLLFAAGVGLASLIIVVIELRAMKKHESKNPFKDKFDGYL